MAIGTNKKGWFDARFYREAGKGVLLGLCVPLALLLVAPEAPSESQVDAPAIQAFDVDANAVRKNRPAFHAFLQGIARDSGVLILGTSESGDMHGRNYFDYLNADSTIGRQFSCLAGAGRFLEVYMPLITANPEAWSGVEVLAFVNPTYWRVGLNAFREDYVERYLDPSIIFDQKAALQSAGVWEAVYSHYSRTNAPMKEWGSSLARWLDQKRRNTMYFLGTQSASVASPFTAFTADVPPQDKGTIAAYQEEIDPTFNIARFDASREKPMNYMRFEDRTSFRTDVVMAFVRLCRQYDIRLTVVIGSYNRALAQATRPSEVPAYDAMIVQLRQLLEQEAQSYIDVSSLSDVPGTYRDHQHHSRYGAYRTYQIIREAYVTH